MEKIQSTKNITRLFYYSAMSDKYKDSDLAAILDVAQKNNKDKGITGMLLVVDKYFCQILEGDINEVDALYNKILKDPRHQDFKLLVKQPIPDSERFFKDWSMGMKVITDDYLEDLEMLSKNKGVDLKTYLNSNSHLVFDMMRHLYIHEEFDFTMFWGKPKADFEI